jgi:lipid A 3-O-deacylase
MQAPMNLKLFTFLVFLLAASGAFAQTHSTEIGAETDDDSYLGQGFDRYYTAGQYLYYRHALKVADNSTLANKVLGFEIGQKIYTPQTGSIADVNGVDQPSLIDRPFAGYLYIGSTLNLLYKNESNLVLSAQAGVVGPGSLDRQTVDFVHDNFGFYHPSGYEYQITNDYELNLSAQYNKLLARASWIDVSFSDYANLGIGFTGAGAGGMVRMGSFNQLFNSVSTKSSVTQKTGAAPFHKTEIFFYYQPLLNYVAYDATIQGGLFENHTGSMEVTKDKEPFVFSSEYGVGFASGHFEFNVAIITHTLDDKEQTSNDSWGAVTGFYRFK